MKVLKWKIFFFVIKGFKYWGKIFDLLFKYIKVNCMCIFGSSFVYICKLDVDF